MKPHVARLRRAPKSNRFARQFEGLFLVEQLEVRRLLSAALRLQASKGAPVSGTIATKAEPAKPVTFKAPGINRVRQTTAANSGTRGDTRTSINVGAVVNISRASGNQSEADIAINPTNPDQIFAQSNITSGAGLFASRSNDGGVTWTTSTIATGSDGLTGACCDGRVIYDKFGNLWLVYLNSAASQLVIARSTNNGASWTQMLSRASSWDNPDIGTGADGSTWVSARGTGGIIAFGWKATGLGTLDTTIGGGTGFSPNQVISVAGSGNYGDVAVGNDGSVYVTWTSNPGGQGPNTNPVVRDPDGFGAQPFSGILTQPTTNVGGFDFIPPQDSRSVDSEPSLAIAPLGTAFAGRVYFEYLQETVNENNDTDVVLRYSDDNGATWSNEIRINDDPASPIRSQFLNQIAVDPTTGAIVASWHDSRNDNGVSPNGTNAVANDDAQFFGALSTDGGVTWTNFMIDPGWSNAARANNGIDFGDWTGSDFYGGEFFAVWASNAQGTNGLPNNPTPNQLDLATARVDIVGAGLPGIYGLVFDDANGNGARDGGEVGVAGVTVYLDVDNSGTLTAGDFTTTTGSSGSYAFNSLAADKYTIRADVPPGLRLSFPAGGSYTVDYDAVNSITAQNFGFVNPRIAGIVFNDANDNGVFDGSESGLAGATVYIDANNSTTFDAGDISTTTAADGSYSLGGLADGNYIVRIVTPAGRRLTFPAAASYSHTISSGSLIFTGDNFGSTDRVRLTGRSFRDDNGNGLVDAGEPFFAGARIFQDLNNNGSFDNTGGTFNSTNVPLPVPPSGTTGITTSNLVVSGVGNVSNLTVKLNITHTFDGDLILTLISPAGTRLTLSNRHGGSGDNYTNTVFDDAAATSITAGTAPFAGSFKPDSPLSTLNGQNGNGTWKLEINDAASGDSGTLNSWSITLGSTEPNTLTAADGTYSFPGLSAGSYNLRQVPLSAEYVFTTPVGGGTILNASSGDLITTNFGNFLTAYSGTDFIVRLDSTATNVQVWVDAPITDPPTYSAPESILNTLSFTGTAGDDSLTVDAQNGSPIPSGGITFDGAGDGPVGDSLYVKGSKATPDTVSFSAGSASVNGTIVTTSNVEVAKFDGRGGNDVLTVSGGPDVQIFNTQHLASLTVANGASASVPADGGTLIDTQELSIAPAGRLDLYDNDLMLQYVGGSQLPAVEAQIVAARNNGNWLGAGGLFSTSAKNNPQHNTTLGAMEASDYTLVHGGDFDGEAPGSSAVLVKYTYYGDTNFSGTVNFDDYVRVDVGFNTALTGWVNGDFDFSASVNFDDYVLIDVAFNTQASPL